MQQAQGLGQNGRISAPSNPDNRPYIRAGFKHYNV